MPVEQRVKCEPEPDKLQCTPACSLLVLMPSMFNTTCCLLRASGLQVTLCYTTNTDKLGFVSWGEEYRFHFWELWIFSFCSSFISSCQIALSQCRSAWRITILVYRGSIMWSLLRSQIWPTFPCDIAPSIWGAGLHWVSKIDGLVCLGGLSCLRCYHTLSGLAYKSH